MNTLLHFNEFVKEISSNGSKKFKQSVLQKYKDDEVIQRYLKINFDPYTRYGISVKKLYKEVRVGECLCPLTVFDLFDYLAEHNTGRDYDVAVCQIALEWLAQDDTECAQLLELLICKDLNLGVDAKSINSVIPGLIPTFNVQLANKYFDKPEYVEGKDFAITTKIDGGRIIALKENGQVSFYTRAGQRYEGLVDLEQEMLEKLPDGLCLDGEITIFDNKGIPSKEAYKRAMKITRSDGEKHGLKMIVFDAMLAEEFRAQKCDRVWEERRRALEFIFGTNNHRNLQYFELLPVLYLGQDTSKITEFLDEAIANKEEGIMINIALAPYEFKRTNFLLKVKKMSTLDLEIVGFEEGSGRLAGTLGAIHVRYKNGNIVKVGSGFSDELRALIWLEPSDFIGKIAEISYFEETTNASGGVSLRFPIFKDFRPDKLEADF
jgi:DNA ligase-1